MQLWRLITLRKECDIFALWLFTLEKHPDTWHNLSQKRLSLAVFHNFDACVASCRVCPWCKKHYLSMHFESGQLNSRGDVLRRSSQCWHLTDIHQLHNGNADWLAAPPHDFAAAAWESSAVSLSLSHWNTRHQEGMPRRIRGIEHPRGRYSSQPSSMFSQALQTQQWPFSWLARKLLTLRRPQQSPSVGGSRRAKSCKLLSALRKPNCKCVWKHSWCSGDGSDDWRLFALLAIYNSPMSANKAKPLPVRCSPMMDDLLRDFQEPLLFETLHPHPEPTHKNTLSTRPFPEHWPRGETDTFTRSSAKFPRRGMKTSGSRIHSRLSDKNKAGWEDCVSVAYTYLKEWCEILSPQRSLLSWWQCGIVSFNPLSFFSSLFRWN